MRIVTLNEVREWYDQAADLAEFSRTVVTVKFEGVIRDQRTGRLSLRDPKIAVIRSDKSASEADDTRAIEPLYLGQQFG